MDLLTILFIALGLSMDAVAVSMANGCACRKVEPRQALRLALAFGFFQMLMPVAGWLAGMGFRQAIAAFDHWLAFLLLGLIGGRMMLEARRAPDCRAEPGPLRLPVLLGLAVATSIDALAVGFSFSALAVGILAPVLLIGLVTFGLSLLGVFAGHRFGTLFAGKVEVLGGLILVAIGLKILLEHLGGG